MQPFLPIIPFCMKRGFLCPVIMIFILALSSCSATKFVPDGSYLLDEVRITSDTKDIRAGNFKSYVRQNPNTKWFSLLKTQLHIYNLSGRDSSRWINRFLRRIGDEPVIYDEALAERSQTEIKKALNNMGYMAASVKRIEKKSKKKLDLTFSISPGKPYIIKSLHYDISDKTIEKYLQEDSINTNLKEGMLFDVNVLDAERQRIVDYLMQRGYYKFNKDYISYTADTVNTTLLVDVTMHLHLYKASATDNPQNHFQYKINKVNFITDYDVLQSSALSSIEVNDSVHYNDFPIYFKDKLYIRPKVLVDNTRIRPGSLYNERAVQNTYSSFGRLSAFKYTNIRFFETQQGDTAKLNCYVMLTKGKPKSVTFELEGTNSAGDLGAAASVSFQNRNIFKGSETFTLKFRGAYEAISGLQEGYKNNNYTEYGTEASLNFPSFIFPFLSTDFKQRIRANSELGLQYNSQLRPEFSKTVASASWSYKWTSKQRSQHRFDLLDVNYVYMPWISQAFYDTYISDSTNSILKYNYENHLIVRMGYTYTYNSSGGTQLNNTTAANSYSIRANIESAGNILYGISQLAQLHKKDGSYTVLNIPYAQYVKGDFDYAKNIQIDPRNSFAFHMGFGIAYPYGNSSMLPFEKRYFSGGANSVRGWSVRALGPGRFKGDDKNIDFMNQSGDIKLDFSAEYRSKLFWKIQGAVFVDAGNIWTIRDYKDQPGGMFKFNTFYKEIAFAYGLGIRFDFDFFVLRFDGGMKALNPVYTSGRDRYPILHPDFGRDFAFHFAVGYPF